MNRKLQDVNVVAETMNAEVKIDLLRFLERIVAAKGCRPGHVGYYSRKQIEEAAVQILKYLDVA